MNFRKIVSLSIAVSFLVLAATGLISYFKDYSRVTATIHTVFGLLFMIGVVFHITNNFQPIKRYSKGLSLLMVLLVGGLLFSGSYLRTIPFQMLMDYGTKLKANGKKKLDSSIYEIVEMPLNKEVQLTIDLLRAEHYWHPQMAVWVEDTVGNYVETLFVSKATAKGLFFGGRSKENFKEFDEQKDAKGEFRRVNALPVWSHNRGVKYNDGMYVPSHSDPLPDGITGATISDNFMLLSSIEEITRFKLKIEINVAFDDNEYYSEFDFPNDEIFHNGTGQLGQPSIVFEVQIDMDDNRDYYLMELVGHGHHSGQNGQLHEDLSKLTTALEIVKRIVVGVEKKESMLSSTF